MSAVFIPFAGLLLLIVGAGCPKRPPEAPRDGRGGPVTAAMQQQRLDPTLVAKLVAAKPAPSALRYGVLGPNRKVRPRERPSGLPKRIALLAGRNEFEAFQIVLTSASGAPVTGISAMPLGPLRGPGGATIAASELTLYRAGYYKVKVASNSEGAAGRWPDPLIPDVDAYVGERRNAFPLTVPADESRVIWVDLLVPQGAKPGDYTGAVAILGPGSKLLGRVELALKVGRFTLPSTASLRSAFGMDYAEPCKGHMGTDSCDPQGYNAETAYQLRERYLRAGLDHRMTISNIFYQPPPAEADSFSRYVLPLVRGTGRTRLRGARFTAIEIDGGDQADIAAWVRFARKLGFEKLLVHYPIDEPGSDRKSWRTLDKEARRAGKLGVKTLITAAIKTARRFGAADHLQIFVPLIGALEDRTENLRGVDRTRHQYDRWLKAKPGRELWAYQSCMSHGCGSCGQPSPSVHDRGWPQRVIDSSAVQDRAFPWVAFSLDVTGELYFAATEQLGKAWDDNGLCKFSGSGEGTIFYPGTPKRIGGSTDIPVETIRLKLIREGMEDYEYLLLAAKRDKKAAHRIAKKLFPTAFACAQPPEKLEAARAALFAIIERR